ICSARCVVVGIVGDVRFGGLDTPTDAEVYYPFAQVPEPTMAKTIGSMAIVVRTKGDPGALSTELDNQVHSIDTKIPLSSVQTMERSLAQSLAPRRFSMLLLAFFAGVALILAAVGIYGVVGYWVAQRTREIGIRIALGARLADVIKVVVAEAMSIVLIGLAAGLVAAFVLSRVLASSLPNLLFHVRATDPLTFALVGCAIFLVALSACYLPARRAARVDPTVALRYE
ncbi:MAG: FtsX-like permease family protein, partial [Blastocatellia bacterium]